MRIWDVSPKKLCRSHLLGEHRELHAIWSILTKSKRGYSRHPEVLRWKGKLKALYTRHELLVDEMAKRGYIHKSQLDIKIARGAGRQRSYVDTYAKQVENLRAKRCGCRV